MLGWARQRIPGFKEDFHFDIPIELAENRDHAVQRKCWLGDDAGLCRRAAMSDDERIGERGAWEFTMTSPPPDQGVLYLDDLHVGQAFTSAVHVVDEDQIKAFARQFDPQPFHLDDEAAKSTIFAGLAASGWHTAAITMKLLVESVPLAGGVIGGGSEISWPKPARPGDALRVESKVAEITPSRSRPDRGMVVMHSETLNQRGEAVQILAAKLVVARRARSEQA
ncbi:MAG: MaoC family dehydratase [Roseiarcus sp.]